MWGDVPLLFIFGSSRLKLSLGFLYLFTCLVAQKANAAECDIPVSQP